MNAYALRTYGVAALLLLASGCALTSGDRWAATDVPPDPESRRLAAGPASNDIEETGAPDIGLTARGQEPEPSNRGPVRSPPPANEGGTSAEAQDDRTDPRPTSTSDENAPGEMAGQGEPETDEEDEDEDENPADRNGPSKSDRDVDVLDNEPHEEDDFRTDLLGKALNLDLADSGFSIFGWVEANYTANPQVGLNGVNNLLLPNSQANSFVFQQVYLVIEQPTRYRDRINFGYRVDNLFGVDAQNFHDYGFLNNTFAPNTFQYDPVQFYGDLHLPIGEGIDVRGGRFFALPGYEAATAPGRPLLSTSDMFSFGAHPYTQFGVMITWHLTDRIELYNGVVNGWNRWINENVPWSYAGGFNWSSDDDRTNLTVTLNAGFTQFARVFPTPASIPSRPIPGSGFDPFGLRNSETVLFTEVLTHRLTDDLTLVVEADEADVNQLQPLLSPGPATGHASYYGLAGWLLDQFTEKTTGVARAEVFRDNNGLLTGYSDNFYEVTLGLIHKPVPWFWIRPEIRYDWAQFTRPFLNSSPSDHFQTNHRLTFGFDVIFIF